MLRTRLDHIVVVAPTRAAGVRWVAERLGIAPVEGGAHPAMGTHNALLRLGAREYLEVIAVDPEAPQPPRPRWFALDRLPPTVSPRLATWVARTDDIRVAAERSPVPLGPVEPMSRGALVWSITVPKDGALVLDGALPLLIEWPDTVHPAAALPDSGCSLQTLEVRHPRVDVLRRFLTATGFSGPVTIDAGGAGQDGISAVVRTPAGIRVLSSG